MGRSKTLRHGKAHHAGKQQRHTTASKTGKPRPLQSHSSSHKPKAGVDQSDTNKASNNNVTKKSTASSRPRPALTDPYDARATIPFDFSSDAILLVGEGDLSFAHSLVVSHNAACVTATTYDSAENVAEKYPQSADLIAAMHAHAAAPLNASVGDDDDDGNDDDDKDDDEASDEGSDIRDETQVVEIHHSIDARNLHLAAKKLLQHRKGRGFDRVVFNFPHVGGQSTDVNRQVRANQELLVGFFRSVDKVLIQMSGSSRAAGSGEEGRRRPGTVLVTLFESEPYTLWNIKDLARHCGLVVQRSFAFDAGLYPGYEHRRTLGNVRGDGGWKGRDREARTYVFMRKEDAASSTQSSRKRRRADDSDDDETGNRRGRR